jgi:hypothetical protein
LEAQNPHDAFQTWALENLLMGVPFCQVKKLQGSNEKETNAFALLCEHLTDAQLAHIQYCDNVRSAWEALCGVHEAKTIGNKLFLRRRFFTIKMQEGDGMLVHIGESPCGPTTFHRGEHYE